MKSTFSRTFAAAAVILLTAVMLLGTVFPSMVKDYLTEQTVSGLRGDAEVISNLATAYTMEGTLDQWEFMLNLNLAADISDSDVVICNADGRIVICTCPVLGCDHLGMDVDDNYLFKVLQNGGDSATGVIHGLYEESRYVVSVPWQSVTPEKDGNCYSAKRASSQAILSCRSLNRRQNCRMYWKNCNRKTLKYIMVR